MIQHVGLAIRPFFMPVFLSPNTGLPVAPVAPMPSWPQLLVPHANRRPWVSITKVSLSPPELMARITKM